MEIFMSITSSTKLTSSFLAGLPLPALMLLSEHFWKNTCLLLTEQVLQSKKVIHYHLHRATKGHIGKAGHCFTQTLVQKQGGGK